MQSTADLSRGLRDMRQQGADSSDIGAFMASLRGENLNDDDFAAEGQKVSLMSVTGNLNEADAQLPLTYDPEAIYAFWSIRPVSVIKRIIQLGYISSNFVAGLLWDFATGQVKRNEVKRAIQIRDIVTSLGPAYIKLGQALSIRPDLLSPAAMTEMQKLCDKVPSFDNEVAMDVLAQELGMPWHEAFAELTPAPIAAASLGQVYRGKLHTGEKLPISIWHGVCWCNSTTHLLARCNAHRTCLKA
jgi:aarF domain-containing kinase